MPTLEHPRDRVRFGDFEFDPKSGELRRAGSTIRLQPQPLKVLLALIRSPGEIVDKEHLKQELMVEAPYGDADHAISVAVTKLRAALHDSPDRPQFIETLHRRGYRFVAQVETLRAETIPETSLSADMRRFRRFLLPLLALIAASTLILILALSQRSSSRADKQKVVVATFTNSTGDAEFADALRQGLLAQILRAHSLDLVSDQETSRVLAFMRQPRDARLTNELASQVCQRIAGSVAIDGSILTIGNQCVLQLNAVNCQTGTVLAHEQIAFSSKEQVFKRIAEVGSKLNRKLENSPPTKMDEAPRPAAVTTSSFDALKSYSLGQEAMLDGRDDGVAIPLFQRAITLDPNFAMAYAQMGALYKSMGESMRAAEALRKAYSLRQHVSAPEELFIEAFYEHMVTGNLEAARTKYESWVRLYPRDTVPLINLAEIYSSLGKCEQAKPLLQDALQIRPEDGTLYASLMDAELCLGRLDEAKSVAREASSRRADTPRTHASLYLVSFLQHDAVGMQTEIAYMSGLPEWNALFLCMQAETAAYAGKFREARSLVRQGTDLALLSDEAETAANCHADAAVWEALVGDSIHAQEQVRAALLLARSSDVEARSGIALALSGESRIAAHVGNDLARRFPEDTTVHFEYLPTIHGVLALQTGKSTEAAELLGSVAAYNSRDSLAIYLRGKAYLARAQEAAAGAEFHKILMHPGLSASNPVAALAQLEMARALSRAGDAENVMLAYRKFFAVWEHADSEIPVMRQARAEYQELSRLFGKGSALKSDGDERR